MPKQIKEELCLKLNKNEIERLKTFYCSVNVQSVADKWKRKSVSIISPKSGRVTCQKNKVSDKEIKSEPIKEQGGFFSRIFEKNVKISDYTYQQSKARRNSAYKPFWATNVENVSENKSHDEEIKKKDVKSVEKANIIANKNTLIFDVNKVKISTKDVADDKNKKPEFKKIKSYEYNKDHAFKALPQYYAGSKMFMPTGEPLYWVCLSIHIYCSQSLLIPHHCSVNFSNC